MKNKKLSDNGIEKVVGGIKKLDVNTIAEIASIGIECIAGILFIADGGKDSNPSVTNKISGGVLVADAFRRSIQRWEK